MSEISWGDGDAAVWGLVVVGLLFAYVGRALWRRSVLSDLGDRGPLSGLLVQSPLWLRGSRVGLVLVAAALIVVALMRPQHGSRATEVKHLGVDIAVVLDASKSMKAPDVIPDRLEASKLEIRRLLNQIHGGRVALVPFAGLSFVQTPLTSDVEVVKTYLNDLRVEDMPRGGTAIGRAMIEGIRALVPASRLEGTAAEEAGDQGRRDQEIAELKGSEYKAMILITDGEDHEGDPIEAARLAASLGIRVFTVGVGTAQGRPVPVIDDEGRVIGTMKGPDGKTPLFSELNEGLLREIATLTDGAYYPLGPTGMGKGLLASIDALEKKEYEATFRHLRDDRFQLALAPALVLLLLESLLAGLWRRRRS